ncbi:hypothetical protein [Paucisalibacillus globulus]|uniref:hypothetical protein n=1 Tax=Paucisalibacillus globulus TaxID=351095 RepID=UPI000BB8D8C8|nr:hypothetical protein [Paucisalibacillus globulus]
MSKTIDVKPYQNYLYFAICALILGLVPTFSNLLTNLYLQIVFTLLIVYVVSLVIQKISKAFMDFCLRFNLRLVYLYIIYIVLYFSAFMFLI